MKKSYLNLTGEFHGIQHTTKKNDKGQDILTSYVNLICSSSNGALLVIRVKTINPDLFEKTEQRAPVTLPVNARCYKDTIYYTHVI